MNPYLIEIIIKEKHQDMLKEAKRLQLLAAYEAARPSSKSKLLAELGAKLILIGEKLIQRYGRPNCSPELTCKNL
jgi:hypothetical protein